MKLSMTPQPKNGLPLGLIALLTAVALIGVSFAGLADTADAAGKKQPKIVALSPFTANTVSLLGKRLVGVGEVLAEDRGNYTPEIINGLANDKIKTLTLRHPNGPNLEELAKLDPDIVLTSPTWKKGESAMKQLGIRVVTAEPLNLGGIYSATKKIGRVIKAKPKQVSARIKQMKRGVKSAKQTIDLADRRRVMVILGVGRTPFTFLENSWGGHITMQAGGDLLDGDASADGGFARISDEVVLAEQPEVIIAVPHATKGDIPELKEFMETNPVWSETPAVKENRLYISTDNSLLQANTDPGRVIRKISRSYLQNQK